MKNFTWLAIIVLIALGWIFVGGKKEVTENSKPIKIGAALSLSGDAVLDGESIKNGLELAKADLKKKGVDVEIIYQDDKTNPKDTVSAINALHTQGVEAIVGPTWSFLADAGVPVADGFKLVTVQPADTSEYVSTNGSPYAFFTSTRVDRSVPKLATWMKENNIKSVAIVTNEGAWYDTVGKTVSAAATIAGAKVVLYEKIPFGVDGPSMSTLITKVKSKSPDLLFTEVDDDAGIIALLKKSQELKILTPIMSVTTSIGRVLASNAGLSFTNKLYIVAQLPSKEFEDKFRSVYNKPATVYADRAYDSLMLLTEALQNKGDMPLEKYLREKTNYRGLAGTYKFDKNGDITGGDWLIKTVR